MGVALNRHRGGSLRDGDGDPFRWAESSIYGSFNLLRYSQFRGGTMCRKYCRLL
jgi:hypothetical protein